PLVEADVGAIGRASVFDGGGTLVERFDGGGHLGDHLLEAIAGLRAGAGRWLIGVGHCLPCANCRSKAAATWVPTIARRWVSSYQPRSFNRMGLYRPVIAIPTSVGSWRI